MKPETPSRIITHYLGTHNSVIHCAISDYAPYAKKGEMPKFLKQWVEHVFESGSKSGAKGVAAALRRAGWSVYRGLRLNPTAYLGGEQYFLRPVREVLTENL